MSRALRRPYRRDIPRDWETELAELSPRSEQTSWLKLIFEEGYPWEPVERFMIYEMIPAHAVDPEILSWLQRDTPPQGYWDSVLDEFVPEEGCMITKRAHRLYQEFQCWGRPWWVIQGTKGGHKRWFSESDKKLLKLAGLPQEPPAPGDLDYAPFDSRVVTQLVKHDLLRDEQGRIRQGMEDRQGIVGYRAREAKDAKQFRTLLLDWLSEQVAEIAPDAHKALLKMDAPRSTADPKAREAAMEAADERFIEHGRA
jgi:hypothetical protein